MSGSARAGAAEYRAAIRAGGALGHLPVVQGVVWRGAGMDEAAAQAASAHTFCVALLGAALRLGAIGHLQGQAILLGLRAAIADLIAAPVPPVEDMYACTPAARSRRCGTRCSRVACSRTERSPHRREGWDRGAAQSCR